MWWESRQTLIARGIVTIGFGLLLMLWPGLSLTVFVLIFGAFAILDGGLMLTAAAAAPRGESGRSLALIVGALAIVAGLFTFMWPGLTELMLLVLIAVRALVLGGAEIATSVYIWRHGARSAAWLLGALAAISIGFGLVLLAFPGTGLMAMVWVIGFFALAVGVMTIAKAGVVGQQYI